MFEDDGQLLCYPSIVRLLPADLALKIDRRRTRGIRPSVVVEELRRAQQAGPRFKAAPFVSSLLAGYDLVRAQQRKAPGAVVRLVDVYAVITLLPGQSREYSKRRIRPRPLPARPKRCHGSGLDRAASALGGELGHPPGGGTHHGRGQRAATALLGHRLRGTPGDGGSAYGVEAVNEIVGSGLPLGGTGLTPEGYAEFVAKEYLGDYVRSGGAAVRFVVVGSDTVRGSLASGPGRRRRRGGLPSRRRRRRRVQGAHDRSALRHGRPHGRLAGAGSPAGRDGLAGDWPPAAEPRDAGGRHGRRAPRCERARGRPQHAPCARGSGAARPDAGPRVPPRHPAAVPVRARHRGRAATRSGRPSPGGCEPRWSRCGCSARRRCTGGSLGTTPGRCWCRWRHGTHRSAAAGSSSTSTSHAWHSADGHRSSSASASTTRRRPCSTPTRCCGSWSTPRTACAAPMSRSRFPPAAVTDEIRGLPAYSALQLRVVDEVRDRRRANPFAALMRMETRLEVVS